MKTKKLLVLILLLGLSLNAFSQEEVTIKQVIKNSSTNAASYGDAIKVIKIWTKIPVTIRSGKENAIYLTGEMKDNEKDKLSSFCVLKNNVFEISSPYLFLDEESKAKDFSKFRITLELADNVYTYYLRGDNNVTISKDIITDGNGTFNLWANSQIIIEGEAKFEVLNIFAQENSKIRFNSINANGAILNMEKGSIIDLNGKVRDIEIMNQEEGAKLIGEHKGTSLMRHNVDVEDDDFMKRLKIDKAGNIISSKGDTIEKATKEESSLVLKELSDAFEEVSEDLKEEEPNEVIKPIADAFKTVADNLDKEDIKKEKSKEKEKKSKASLTSQFGYGILGWSNRVSNIDNLFTSPKGQYTLAYSDSWSLGFRYEYKLNRRWTISTGLGYESNIFRFENNVKLNDFNGEKRIGFDTSSINAESKLVARYITLP
ncbi:MAG: hypothetical protein PHX48_06365, partial [Bacteroidales bacterium]|nr:hypothetical protein [Bacteroidales bacterium]